MNVAKVADDGAVEVSEAKNITQREPEDVRASFFRTGSLIFLAAGFIRPRGTRLVTLQKGVRSADVKNHFVALPFNAASGSEASGVNSGPSA